MMKVNPKCFATLVDEDLCDYKDGNLQDLTDGQTIQDLIKRAGIDPEDVKIAFVNNRKAAFESATIFCEAYYGRQTFFLIDYTLPVQKTVTPPCRTLLLRCHLR